MARTGKRLDDLFGNLLPEDLAKLVTEDLYKVEPDEKPVIPTNRLHELLRGMEPEEVQRYDEIVSKHKNLNHLCSILGVISMGTEILLLRRDRILLIRKAQENLGDELRMAGVTNNTRRIKVRGLFGQELTFGGKWDKVELDDEVLTVLDAIVYSIKDYVADVKAIVTYLVDEAKTLNSDVVKGQANLIVERLRVYDRPYLEEFLATITEGGEELITKLVNGVPVGSVYNCPHRWALVWEEVEENEETARRIRDDPEHFTLVYCALDL